MYSTLAISDAYTRVGDLHYPNLRVQASSSIITGLDKWSAPSRGPRISVFEKGGDPSEQNFEMRIMTRVP